MSNALHIFRDILNGKGLIPPEIIADGKLHRCPTEGKQHKQNGAYIAHLDTPATLWWCNWESVEQGTFTEAEERTFSQAEKEVLQQRQAAVKQQREAEFAQRQTAAAQKAQSELNASALCSPEHHYLQRKGVPPLADTKPFEANLVTEGSSLQWQIRGLEDVEIEELKRLLSDGYSIRDCAEEMGKSKGAIQRLKKKLDGAS